MNLTSEKQIVELLIQYVNMEKTNYAILIDGEWGCGKTYFIKNTVFSKITSKRPIYISLYGLSSCDEILKQIWLQTVPLRIKGIASSKAGGIASSIILSGLSYFNVDKPKIDYNNLMSLDKCALFFDDLERCDISINEVLGFINNFVEHNGIKTILIANQEEIGKQLSEKNIELRYFISTNKEIDFPEKPRSTTSYDSPYTPKSSKIDINEIDKRVNYLFGRNNEFKRIKEKLVGMTIKYTPNIDLILDPLIKDYVSETHQDFMYKNKQAIVNKLNSNNHNNLRTLIFVFDKFNVLADEICKFKQSYPPHLIDEVLFDVLNYTLEISIKHKIDGYIEKWEENTEYGQKSTQPSALWLHSFIFGFKFVYDFVLFAEFNSQHINYILNSYLKICERNDALYRLKNQWWDMDETTICELINEVNIKLKSKTYLGQDFFVIINLYLKFRKIGFKINIEEVVNMIYDCVDLLDKDELTYDKFAVTHDETYDDIKDEYILLSTQIREKMEKRKLAIESDYINSFFDISNLNMDKFKAYVYSNVNNYFNSRAFFARIDIDKFFDCIKIMKSKDVVLLRHSIYAVYKDSNVKERYGDDIENIDRITVLINEYLASKQCQDLIKSYFLTLLINDLDGYISKQKQADE